MTTQPFLYARHASVMLPGPGEAIKGKLEECRELAEAKGLTVVGEFFDVGLSGTILERPGLQASLAALEKAQARTLIVPYEADVARITTLLKRVQKQIKAAGAVTLYCHPAVITTRRIRLG